MSNARKSNVAYDKAKLSGLTSWWDRPVIGLHAAFITEETRLGRSLIWYGVVCPHSMYIRNTNVASRSLIENQWLRSSRHAIEDGPGSLSITIRFASNKTERFSFFLFRHREGMIT
ncbi:hypothetical protein ACMFMG_002967 [Clarireedia jacksonii]